MNVLLTNEHFGTNFMVPKCLVAEVSDFPSALSAGDGRAPEVSQFDLSATVMRHGRCF